MTQRRECRYCKHYRLTRPEPFSASDLRNPEVAGEMSSRWKDHLNRIEQKELDAYDRGGDYPIFDFEPWFFSWCAHYSSPAPELSDPRDRQDALYLLTEVINTANDCPAFEA
jgi:hypothetical protein